MLTLFLALESVPLAEKENASNPRRFSIPLISLWKKSPNQGQLSGTILFYRPCIRIEPALWLSRSLLQLSYALGKDGLARGVKW